MTERRDSLSTDDEDFGIGESHPGKRMCVVSSILSSSKQVETKDTTNAANENERSALTSVDDTTASQQCDDSIFDVDSETNDLSSRDRLQHPPGQDYHHTSLDVARAFFAKIDADPTLLTLEQQQDSPNPTSKPVCSTTRGRLPRKVALAEYQIYSATCREASVPPIPMPEFLQQRSQFFRPGEVFDGMFDD